MKFKKTLVALLAAIMVIVLCVPASAALQDVACCDDPWLEDPVDCRDLTGYEVYDMTYHEYVWYTVYTCTHCGVEYLESNFIRYEEHYGDAYNTHIDLEGQCKIYYCICDACGAVFTYTEPLN